MNMPEIVNIDHILPFVRKPGRYAGGELHASVRNWHDAEVRFALVFPDLYEIGMSHFGLQILYHILNSREGMLAERCYAPDLDMEGELRRRGMPLFAIESRRPLADFDVIGITLPYELCYTNILTILDLAGIPLRAKAREETAPLVIGGGSCSMNPEPVADFFDAVVLGDGEEVILEVAEAVRRAKREGTARPDVLIGLSQIPGVYVPAFFAPQYAGSQLRGIHPLRPEYTSVRRRVLPGLPKAEEGGSPLVPVVKPIHDRLAIEIARGCTRGCRFCQAGVIYRPVRERSIDDILEAAEKGIACSGFEELALLSLSSGDYSCLPELMTELMDRFAGRYVSISMPSMRVGTLTPEIMNQIRRVRMTGFTVAPEAGTDRLREVINKGISEVDLLQTCRDAFALGWDLIKLYFMIGLPTETMEDVEAIVDLARRARGEAGPRAKRVQINVSVGTFVPKPHTPFQWERQLSLEESQGLIDHLKGLLPRRGFKLKWHDPRQSVMEGVFSRGDRRLAGLIETAWKSGARLDGWSEHYRLEHWQDAAGECGIDLNSYLRARDPGEALPWDHLDSGVDREFLARERERALEREYTPDCRTAGCQQCGLCDFRTIRPVICTRGKKERYPAEKTHPPAAASRDEQQPRFRYRIHYTRLGDSRFFSHLEILQLVFRALRRARVAVLHSRGFNPTPRVSFGAALPVGMESEVEYFDMEVASPLQDPAALGVALGLELPPGMRVTGVEPAPTAEAGTIVTAYEAVLPGPHPVERLQRIGEFLAGDSFVIERSRKGRRSELDIRPLVRSLRIDHGTLRFELIAHQGRPGVNPRQIMVEVLGLSERETLLSRVRKTKRVELHANT
jgi:radical SAM family uncharacterized protein/radical SAM-linked protein